MGRSISVSQKAKAQSDEACSRVPNQALQSVGLTGEATSAAAVKSVVAALIELGIWNFTVKLTALFSLGTLYCKPLQAKTESPPKKARNLKPQTSTS